MTKNKIIKIFSANYIYYLVLLIVPMLIMILGKMVPCYNGNDDFAINQLISGQYTGTPETHLVHIGYLMGVFISSLYKGVSSVPWYSIYIVSCAYLSCVLVFSKFIKYAEKIWQKIILCLISLFLMYGFLFAHIISFQFTTVTAMVCGASIVSFYCVDEKASVKEYLKCQIPSLLLFCVSFELRDDACAMFLPMLCFLGISRFIQNRKMFKQLVAYALVLLGLIAAMFITEKIAYQSAEWKEYLRFSTNRASMVDYEGYPDFEENKEVYEEYGVSKASYEAILKGYMLLLDENVDADFMETAASFSPKQNKSLKDMVKEFYLMHKEVRFDYPINQMVFLMYGMVIFMILLTAKYRALTDVLALLGGRMIIWTYLLYIGRPIFRVTQGIYIVELFVLVAIFCYHKLWIHKEKKRKRILGILIVCEMAGTILVSYRWGSNNLNQIMLQNEEINQNFTAYTELVEQLSEQPENLYLLDVSSVKLFYGDAFSTSLKQNGNCVWMGGWNSNSPYTDRIAKNYQIDDYEKATMERENVYFVFLNSEETPYTYLQNYYADKHPEIQLEVVDVLETSSEEFLILKCTK